MPEDLPTPAKSIKQIEREQKLSAEKFESMTDVGIDEAQSSKSEDVPNDETLAAIREAEEIERHPESTDTYSNVADLIKALNDSAKASGTSEMTLDEINAEISQYRKERRERKEKQ